MLVEEYENKLVEVEQTLTKECIHEKNELDAFKDSLCEDTLESLKNDLFERKKKTIIELDAEWRKKMKEQTAQLQEQHHQACNTEKSQIMAQEEEKCVVKTQKLVEVHESDFDLHQTNSIDLTEDLKITLTEQCDNEKIEMRQKLSDTCSNEKQELLDTLTKRNGDDLATTVSELTKQCQIEKADFK